MTTKKLFIPSLLVTAALVLAGCSSGDSDPGSGESSSDGTRSLKIGAIYMDSQGFYAGVKNGLTTKANASGINVEFVETNAGGDVSKESTFIDTLISSQVDAIVLSAVSADGSVAAIRNAVDAGIPVICYNACVNDEAVEQYVSAWVVGNPEDFGRAIGDYAADFFISKGITDPKFGIVNCEQYEGCQRRQVGFEEALKKKLPDAEVVINQEGTETDRAISVGEQELTAHPEINGMWGQSGGAAEGAYRAVLNTGREGQVFTFGSDMTTDLANGLVQGTVLQASVDVSGTTIGELTWEATLAAIDGEVRDNKIVDAPIVVWTVETGQKWLDEHPDGIP
jgi:simple sugar transport system substrate-binding protein